MCGCGCNSCGTGLMDLTILPPPRRGLGGLSGVKAGSQVRVGFRYSCVTCLPGSLPDDSEIINTVQGCLYASGAYSSVSAAISHGVIYQDYLTIGVVPAIDFNKAEDIAGQIQQTLQQCYPTFASLIDSHDPVQVAPPPGMPQTPVGQFQSSPEEKQQDKPDQCAIDPKTGKERQGLDYLNCKLGLGTTAGLSTLVIPILAAVVIAKAFK